MPAPVLIVPACNGTQWIPVASIIRVEARSNYSKLYFSSGNCLVVAKVLRWFEQRLPAAQFIRLHRTHLVNKDFISRYVNGTGGRIVLQDGLQLDVSKRRKQQFLKNWYGLAA
ncbi:MAG: LytTR family DNA-binding domain-containing protein [Bacteroidetes bacterium]|nr:LytTR family DNA-binding domain-containing protein [Bacteroidota bacterium]